MDKALNTTLGHRFALGFFLLYLGASLGAASLPSLGLLGLAWTFAVFFLICAQALRCWRDLVHKARRDGSWLTVAAILVWLMLLIGLALPALFMSNENILQIGCALKQIDTDRARGFASRCFLGYPSRSFYIQALPALLFGLTPFTANVGASLLLLPGIVIFASGLRRLLGDSRQGDLLSAAALGLLLQAMIILRVIVYHDQTSQPLGYTLLLIGLAVPALMQRDRSSLALLLAIAILGVTAYPPVLPVIGLVWGFIACAWITRYLPERGKSLVVCAGLVALVVFAHSLLGRSDMQGLNTPFFSQKALLRLGRFLVLQRGGDPFAVASLHFLVLAALVVGASGARGWRITLVWAWVVLDVLASFFISGVTPDLAWRYMNGMHRATPAIVVAVVLVALELKRWCKDREISPLCRSILLATSFLPCAWSFKTVRWPMNGPLSYYTYRQVEAAAPHDKQVEPAYMVRDDISVLSEIPTHFPYWDATRTVGHYAGTCLPTQMPKPGTVIVTLRDKVCRAAPDDPHYTLVHTVGAPAGTVLWYIVNP